MIRLSAVGIYECLVSVWLLWKALPFMSGLASSKHSLKGNKSGFTLWNTHWTFFPTNNAQRRESLCGHCFQNSKIVSIGIFFRFLQKENVLSLFLSINKGNDFWLSCYYKNLYFQQERNGIAFITLIVWQFSHCIKNWRGRLKKALICNEKLLVTL